MSKGGGEKRAGAVKPVTTINHILLVPTDLSVQSTIQACRYMCFHPPNRDTVEMGFIFGLFATRFTLIVYIYSHTEITPPPPPITPSPLKLGAPDIYPLIDWWHGMALYPR